MLQRTIQSIIESHLQDQKVSLVLGARRVGKTELLRSIYLKVKDQSIWLEGEDETTAKLLNERSISNYKRLLSGYKYLFIDEAQFLSDITLKAKLMIDTIKPLHIILTGSCTFYLSQMAQPLVGRMYRYHLYPLSHMEWKQKQKMLELNQKLEEKLLYGNYPELDSIDTNQKKETYLKELVNTYLLKDILVFENIRNSDKLKQLLSLLSYQAGSEISLPELARQLNLSKNTVDNYIDLLEKVFVVYRLGTYSNNLRKELSKSKKVYFLDNGIRNAIINDFRPLSIRTDVGALWEQYFLSERLKYNSYNQKNVESFFWKTYDGQEIDLIERESLNLTAFECKWKQENFKIPAAFQKAYSEANFNLINNMNYYKWLENE